MLCLGAYNLLGSGINAEGFGLLAPFAGMLAMLAIIKSTDDFIVEVPEVELQLF